MAFVELVSFLGQSVTEYQIFMFVGLISGFVLVVWQLRQLHMSWIKIMVPVPLTVVFAVAGARIVDIYFYYPERWVNENLLAVFSGGMSSHGAVLGLSAATCLLAFYWHRPIRVLADRLVLWALIGLVTTRFADQIVGSGLGNKTDLAWAVDGRYPTHYLEIVLAVLLFVGVFVLRRFWGTNRPGAAATLMLLVYFVFRLPLDGMREVNHLESYPEIAIGQALSVPFIVFFGVVFFLWVSKKRDGVKAHVSGEDVSPTENPIEQSRAVLYVRSVLAFLLGALLSGVLGSLALQIVTLPKQPMNALNQLTMSDFFANFLLWMGPVFGFAMLGVFVGRLIETAKSKWIKASIAAPLLLITFGLVVFLMRFAGDAPAAGAWLLMAAVLPFRHNIRDLMVFIITGGSVLLIVQFAKPVLPEYFPHYVSGAMIPLYFGTAGVLANWAREAAGLEYAHTWRNLMTKTKRP
jgi:phosphatidylglycerol---prolipoprotein diacylglyceryl transferase